MNTEQFHSLSSFKNKNIPNRIIFKNARIIDPATNCDQIGDLIVQDNKIIDFGANILDKNITSSTPEIQLIDCNQHILCPGLIDIQVHFRDPGQTHKEDIISGTKAAASAGITSVVCQPNTAPVIDSDYLVNYVQNKAKEQGYINVYTYGSITKSLKGKELSEMGLMQEAGAVGFTDDGLPVMNAFVMRKSLEYAKSLGTVIAQHAEDLNLSNHGCINEGVISNKLGVSGIPNQSESIIVERDLSLVALTKSRYHLLHISTKESLQAIKRAKEQNLNVTCEVTPHHLLLTDQATDNYNTNAKMNPPLRAEEDRIALIEALKEGVIDAIATDHAPHDAESKLKPLAKASFGIVGVETMLSTMLSLYHQDIIPLDKLLGLMTYKPASIINIDRGRIEKGKIADLTLFDLNYDSVIDANKFHSKSKNTPFNNLKVKGKTLLTMVNGNIVYRNMQ